MSSKQILKYVKIQQQDGSYSNAIPIVVNADNVSLDENGNSLSQLLGEYSLEDDGTLSENFDTLKNHLTILDNTKANINQIQTPLIVTSPEDMIDTGKIYVYLGEDTEDYENGKFYYYDGTEWTLGGTYNAVAFDTDTSLSVPNMAADAAAVGLQIDRIDRALRNITIDKDDLGLYQDPETFIVYPTYRGQASENGIPLAGGGGGGGGGGSSAILTVTNTTGWLSKTISQGASCTLSFTWSSIEDQMPTGNGTLKIVNNGVTKRTQEIQQGQVSVQVSDYLIPGDNTLKITISDVYGTSRLINFNITVIALSLTSSFNTSSPFTDSIDFRYTPTGEAEKTVYFYLDGSLYKTVTTSFSRRQLSEIIPAQSHGAHTLRVYFTAVINEQTVSSNELYFEFMSIVEGNNTPIIISSFNQTTANQYYTLQIPYIVYTPNNLTSSVTFSINNTMIAMLVNVDRTEHSFSYRVDTPGTLVFKISSGGQNKQFTITVIQSTIDVQPVAENLELHLSSYGRSNNESNPAIWTYGTGSSAISCTLSNFNFVSDGWLTDNDGVTVLRVTGDARVTIPYKIFAQDFRTTGKTIEIQLATKNVLNYDSTILSCFSGGKGLTVAAQAATLKSQQSSITAQFKEDQHIRISFVIQKRSEHRLLYTYINGIASGVIQYPVNDDFQQPSAVDITIGSNYCTTDIYNIRIYNNDLTRYEIVNNWIADTQDGATKVDRYIRNDIFDAYGNIIISKLPSDLPYMIISCQQLPQYKGDKKTCKGSFVDPTNPSRSFTFTNCQIDVQGTSSQYYPRKNYKMKFNGGFTMTSTGRTESKFAMDKNSIPVKTFCMKADFASSQGANNVELVRLYCNACPYKTPAQEENSLVRQGIDGFPMIIFWNNTATNTTEFIGKYNFNNDKSTEEVFGFQQGDESWQTLNNTSERVLYKSADFSGTAWQADFEARYPDTDPPYVDSTQLEEFVAWAASTDTTAATNDPLPYAITYDGVLYTTDSADYRLAKFKAQAGDYMELDSALFYYLFTELFLMVDSRAKNAFPSFIGDLYSVK